MSTCPGPDSPVGDVGTCLEPRRVKRVPKTGAAERPLNVNKLLSFSSGSVKCLLVEVPSITGSTYFHQHNCSMAIAPVNNWMILLDRGLRLLPACLADEN